MNIAVTISIVSQQYSRLPVSVSRSTHASSASFNNLSRRSSSARSDTNVPKKACDKTRPSSARSDNSDVSNASEFLGGKRMEHLLQALNNERTAGGFFQKYIERSHNKVCKELNIDFLRFVSCITYHLSLYL